MHKHLSFTAGSSASQLAHQSFILSFASFSAYIGFYQLISAFICLYKLISAYLFISAYLSLSVYINLSVYISLSQLICLYQLISAYLSLSQLISAYLSLSQLISAYLSLSVYKGLSQLICLYQLLDFLVSHPQTVRCIITTFNNSDEGSCHITLRKRDTRKFRKGACKSTFIICFRGERDKSNHYLLNTKSSSVVTCPRGLGGPMYYTVDQGTTRL